MYKHDNEIFEELGLRPIKQFTQGNVCESVYMVEDVNSRLLVLKIGLDERSVAEIVMNVTGYERMRELGLSKYIPREYKKFISGKSAYSLMEYCGEDFLTKVRNVRDPLKEYKALVIHLTEMYKLSIIDQGEKHSSFLKRVILSKILSTYHQHIKPIFGVNDEIELKLNDLSSITETFTGHSSCFSNWDMTPEDVYLTQDGLKYSDPLSDVLGIPIVDIGCFAGVARDAYHLPGSDKGYEVLYQLSRELACMLKIDQYQAEQCFYFGRLLQSWLSARHRLNKDLESAERLFHQGIEHLSRIVA